MKPSGGWGEVGAWCGGEAHLLVLGSFLALSAGLTLFQTFPKDPLDISSVMFTVAGSLLQKKYIGKGSRAFMVGAT